MLYRRRYSFLVFLGALSLVFLAGPSHKVLAADVERLEGYAWSSNIGWLSFSCHNANSCNVSDYGVSLDADTGALSGYAWSPVIGWVSFNASDVTGCPTGSCPPKLISGVASGWARALLGDAGNGWEGWIHLAGPGYGVTLAGDQFSGFSWSNDVIGWLKWKPILGPGVHKVPGAVITTGVSGGGTNSDVRVVADVCGQVSCSYSYNLGDSVDLFAYSGAGYTFSTWTGANASECQSLSNRICSGIILSASKDIKAVFRTVNCPSDGPGFCPACNDAIDNDADSKTDFPADTNCPSLDGLSESYTATACDNCLDDDDDGEIDWVNDTGCNNDYTDNNEVNAVLTAQVSLFDSAVGKISSAPAGIDCGTACSKEYVSNEQVGLSAVPVSPGAYFWRWGGACSGTNPVCNLSMTLSKTAKAFFGTTAVPSCPGAGVGACPQCHDGIDNDGDNRIDYPLDQQCTSYDDPTEFGANLPLVNCPSAGVGACPECNDNFDNDTDGTTDFPQDLQCSSSRDDSEGGLGVTCPAGGLGICPVCNDGVDNDGDDKVDLDDPNCEDDPNGGTESPDGLNCPSAGVGTCPQCNDGIDNTDPEDTIKDYPLDPGCYSRSDNNETDPVIQGNCPADGQGICPQCNDGIDNDGDGFTDWFGWDADSNGTRETFRDASCQGEPNKNTETGQLNIIEI